MGLFYISGGRKWTDVSSSISSYRTSVTRHSSLQPSTTMLTWTRLYGKRFRCTLELLVIILFYSAIIEFHLKTIGTNFLNFVYKYGFDEELPITTTTKSDIPLPINQIHVLSNVLSLFVTQNKHLPIYWFHSLFKKKCQRVILKCFLLSKKSSKTHFFFHYSNDHILQKIACSASGRRDFSQFCPGIACF